MQVIFLHVSPFLCCSNPHLRKQLCLYPHHFLGQHREESLCSKASKIFSLFLFIGNTHSTLVLVLSIIKWFFSFLAVFLHRLFIVWSVISKFIYLTWRTKHITVQTCFILQISTFAKRKSLIHQNLMLCNKVHPDMNSNRRALCRICTVNTSPRAD